MDTSGGGREEEMKEMGAEMEGKWKWSGKDSAVLTVDNMRLIC